MDHITTALVRLVIAVLLILFAGVAVVMACYTYIKTGVLGDVAFWLVVSNSSTELAGRVRPELSDADEE